MIRDKIETERYTLYLGDCLQVMPAIEAGSVNAVCADLPYGTTKLPWDDVIPLDNLWTQYLRVARMDAPIILMAQTPFDKTLGCSRLDLLRYEWIWHKTEATGHLNSKRMPMKAHENVLVFYRRLPTYNPIKTFGHERKTAVARRSEDGSRIYGTQKGVTSYDSTSRLPRSVLTFSTDKQRVRLHPTQKPLALLEYFVTTYTNAGDTLLDNCMGSGTAGVACAKLGRKFIGIEADERYFKIAANRIAKETGQPDSETR